MGPAERKRLRARAARGLGVPASPLWQAGSRLLEVTRPLGLESTARRAGAARAHCLAWGVEGAPQRGPSAGVRVRPGGRAVPARRLFFFFAVMSSAAAAGSREAAAGAAPGGRRRFMCM